jgi:hypothetical protein
LPFVTYNGPAKGYLLILTNKKRTEETPAEGDQVAVAALYLRQGRKIAVSDFDLQILKDQRHIGKGKLEIVSEDKQKPILRSKKA